MKRAKRLALVPDYHFARWAKVVSRAVSRGGDVIRLDIGNPDLAPPAEVIQKLNQSAGIIEHHGYPGYRGIPALRKAIAAYYGERFGVTLDPEEQVVPLLGSKEGIINLSLACLDPGDLVLVPDPGYAPYTAGAILAGAEVYRFPLAEENGWQPNFDAIPESVAARAEMIWLNFPNNPTGATAQPDLLARAVAFAQRNQILLCHDAPYCDITFGEYRSPSVLQIEGSDAVAVELNSLSKSWNMPGWRVGMAVGNARALSYLSQIKSNMDSGIFRPVQEAATQALLTGGEWMDERNAVLAERMENLYAGAVAAGMRAKRPRASLYLWALIPEWWSGEGPNNHSEQFARQLLDETGIAVAPGSFFGPGGEGYVRISVTAPSDRIEEAVKRLVAWSSP